MCVSLPFICCFYSVQISNLNLGVVDCGASVCRMLFVKWIWIKLAMNVSSLIQIQLAVEEVTIS
jgi:hypothetical protein